MSEHQSLTKWELIGFLWIITLGSLLHFTFELSGYSKLIALFSPVNESVWEHLKLGYFSLAFFMVIEYFFVEKEINSFFVGKTLGIIAMSSFIVFVFYSYEFIAGTHNLALDIAAFIVGALICQIISFNILKRNISKSNIGVIIFILLGLIFIFFTFYPPELLIFMDSRGFYGINK